jgi:hypothetical protein
MASAMRSLGVKALAKVGQQSIGLTAQSIGTRPETSLQKRCGF